MDAGSEDSRTDWARLKRLEDEEIDQAVASDADTYVVEGAQNVGRAGASYRYVIYRSKGGDWRWRLIDSAGQILAVSPGAYPSRKGIESALRSLRKALLGASAAA